MNSPGRQVIIGVVVAVVDSGMVVVVELVVGAGVDDVVGNATQDRSFSSLPSQRAEDMFSSYQGSHLAVHEAHCCALKLSLPKQVRLT
jgi:hypothetical protein